MTSPTTSPAGAPLSLLVLHSMAAPRLDVLGFLSLAAQLDFGGVELISDSRYPGSVPLGSLRELTAVADAAADSGLRIDLLSSYAQGLDSDHAETARLGELQLRQDLDRAAALGARGLRILAGGAPVSRAGWAPAAERFARRLREVAPHADDLGLMLLVETHMDTLADTAPRALTLMQAVDDPDVGLVLDPSNLLLVDPGFQIEDAECLAPHVHHVHAKNFRRGPTIAERTPTPLGQGEVQWSRVLDAIAQWGYHGPVTLEYEARWYHDLPPIELAAPGELSYLSGWCARPVRSAS